MNQRHDNITSVLEAALWNPDHPPPTPSACTLNVSSRSHTLGNCNSRGEGVPSIQIPEPSGQTHPHPPLPPHWNTIPGWCVDSHLAVTEGSLAGAWERPLSTQVHTPASPLALWPCAALHFPSLSFLLCKTGRKIVLCTVAVKVRQDYACKLMGW